MQIFKHKKISSSYGFTLIELLVVIAIIGTLAAIVLVSLNSARAQARDSRRKAEFLQFLTALEMFYYDYGVYPCGDANAIAHNGTVDSSMSEPFLNGNKAGESPPSQCTGSPDFGLATAGLISNPWMKDPLNINPQTYWYTVDASRQKYVLYVVLEKDSQAATQDGGLCNNYYEIGSGVGELVLDRLNVIGVTCN